VVVLAVGRRVASVGVAWDGRDSRGVEPDRKRMGKMSKCAVVYGGERERRAGTDMLT
jgi:hypothetical protein